MGKNGKLWLMADSHQTGTAKIKLDDRGRLAVPNRYRPLLQRSGGFYLTAHPHGCLTIYDAVRFAYIQEQFEQRSNHYHDTTLEDMIIGCAEQMQLDSAGRILISNGLRAEACIDREVRMFSLPDSIRIWDDKIWEQKKLLMVSRLQDDTETSELWRNVKL